MARMVTATKQDTLGLLALGSIIVNVAQGEAHSQLTAWYNKLRQQYGLICREFLALRKVNEDLQMQTREYVRIIDKLRVENSQLQKRLIEGKGS